jgi:hypothetical protein
MDVRVKCERIDLYIWLRARQMDYEGITCDYCGAPMTIGDQRWEARYYEPTKGPGIRRVHTSWYVCSEECLAATREEIG